MSPSNTASQPFQHWLLQQAHRDEPIGDLARDVRDDLASDCLFPFDTWRDVRSHMLMRHGAIPEALTALYEAHQEWRALVFPDVVPQPHRHPEDDFMPPRDEHRHPEDDFMPPSEAIEVIETAELDDVIVYGEPEDEIDEEEIVDEPPPVLYEPDRCTAIAEYSGFRCSRSADLDSTRCWQHREWEPQA